MVISIISESTDLLGNFCYVDFEGYLCNWLISNGSLFYGDDGILGTVVARWTSGQVINPASGA